MLLKKGVLGKAPFPPVLPLPHSKDHILVTKACKTKRLQQLLWANIFWGGWRHYRDSSRECTHFAKCQAVFQHKSCANWVSKMSASALKNKNTKKQNKTPCCSRVTPKSRRFMDLYSPIPFLPNDTAYYYFYTNMKRKLVISAVENQKCTSVKSRAH